VKRAVVFSAWTALGAMLAVSACGDENSLVGGVCTPGYVASAGACVPGEADGAAEDGSSDVVTPDSGGEEEGDASTTADGPSDGSGDGRAEAASDAEDVDAISSDAVANDATGTDACVPPFDTNAQCGSCTTSCAAADTCKPVDGGFACMPRCAPPTEYCAGVCVDLKTDPDNCGACGRFCASGLCTGGSCVGATPGDVVYIGHDYFATPTGTAQGRVLGNAALLPARPTVRMLSYERYANSTAVGRAKAIVNAVAGQRGRAVSFTATVTDSDIVSTLTVANYDALIVYDQSNAPAGALGALGAAWNTSLTAFTKAGGAVIVLDGNSGTTREMPSFATNAGLLTVTQHRSLASGTAVDVVAPTDTVGAGVLSPYGVTDHSAQFRTPSAFGVTIVVQNSANPNDPVVAHRFVP
jgi:hypothetical protein